LEGQAISLIFDTVGVDNLGLTVGIVASLGGLEGRSFSNPIDDVKSRVPTPGIPTLRVPCLHIAIAEELVTVACHFGKGNFADDHVHVVRKTLDFKERAEGTGQTYNPMQNIPISSTVWTSELHLVEVLSPVHGFLRGFVVV
jgi:hypothetical protein